MFLQQFLPREAVAADGAAVLVVGAARQVLHQQLLLGEAAAAVRAGERALGNVHVTRQVPHQQVALRKTVPAPNGNNNDYINPLNAIDLS